MKPRLESLPLTPEDRRIMARGYPYPPGVTEPKAFFYGLLAGSSERSDRRDADLMWLIERVRIATRDVWPTTYPKWPIVMILIRADAAMGLSWPNGEPL